MYGEFKWYQKQNAGKEKSGSWGLAQPDRMAGVGTATQRAGPSCSSYVPTLDPTYSLLLQTDAGRWLGVGQGSSVELECKRAPSPTTYPTMHNSTTPGPNHQSRLLASKSVVHTSRVRKSPSSKPH